jgi:hypothetical protein
MTGACAKSVPKPLWWKAGTPRRKTPAIAGTVTHETFLGLRPVFNWSVTAVNPPDPKTLLFQFHRLMEELISGKLHRNTFQSWEIHLLLDIESCRLRQAVRERVLRRYQKAMEARIRKNGAMPIKLSEFLKRQYRKRRTEGTFSE